MDLSASPVIGAKPTRIKKTKTNNSTSAITTTIATKSTKIPNGLQIKNTSK